MSNNKVISSWNDYKNDDSKNERIAIWSHANKVLYDMCTAEPRHTDTSIVAGKLLLIGRSYAAAFERRKKATDGEKNSTEQFYIRALTPNKWAPLDEWLEECDTCHRVYTEAKNEENRKAFIAQTIITHRRLVDLMRNSMDNNNSGEGMNKISLASKYLHFHRPEYFYLYDERARSAIGKYISKRVTKKEIEEYVGKNPMLYNQDYASFVLKAEILRADIGEEITPRELDDFLLYAKKD